MQTIVSGVHMLPIGIVNVYLVETPGGLVVIDTGFPGAAGKIIEAAHQLGYAPDRIAHVILTHAHPDHVGSVAELVRQTGAQTWMHADDAPLVERAEFRPVHPSAGIVAHLFHLMLRLLPQKKMQPARIDHRIAEGDALPITGLHAIHAPGHCLGQVALFWPERAILFAADTCMNVRRLHAPLVNEDEAVALRSLERLASLDFEIVCFGHGQPIMEGGADRFSRQFEAVHA